METIAYAAPSAAGTIEYQVALLRPHVSGDQFILIDRPKKPGTPIPRVQRDFVFAHMLRTALENEKDGKPCVPDRLVVVSLDVLGESRDEVKALFRALIKLGVPLISLADGLDGNPIGAEYVVKWVDAMDRAEGRWARMRKAARPKRRVRKGTATGGRPKALSPAEIKEVVRLKEAERLTWPQIEAHFVALGRKVKSSTLRAYYAQATSE